MTKPRRANVPPWAAAVEDILADGQWHNGRRALSEGMKLIPPGIAQRVAEQERAGRPNAPAERTYPSSVEEQIRVGKRRIMARLVAGRLRNGYWESDPPYPLGSPWTGPNFKLRDPRKHRMSIPEVAAHCGVPVSTVEPVLAQSAVTIHMRGKNRFIAREDLEKFAAEVEAWIASTSARRAESTRKAMRTRAARGRNLWTPTTVSAIDSVLGEDPDTPAQDRLVKLQEQAREAGELWHALRVCRDELARLLVARGDDEAGDPALRAVDKASRALDLTAGLFPELDEEKKAP